MARPTDHNWAADSLGSQEAAVPNGRLDPAADRRGTLEDGPSQAGQKTLAGQAVAQRRLAGARPVRPILAAARVVRPIQVAVRQAEGPVAQAARQEAIHQALHQEALRRRRQLLAVELLEEELLEVRPSLAEAAPCPGQDHANQAVAGRANRVGLAKYQAVAAYLAAWEACLAAGPCLVDRGACQEASLASAYLVAAASAVSSLSQGHSSCFRQNQCGSSSRPSSHPTDASPGQQH